MSPDKVMAALHNNQLQEAAEGHSNTHDLRRLIPIEEPGVFFTLIAMNNQIRQHFIDTLLPVVRQCSQASLLFYGQVADIG